MKISNELLSKIIGLEIVDNCPTYIYGGIHIKYASKYNKLDKIISIYEVAYLCKVWASKQQDRRHNGFYIVSGLSIEDDGLTAEAKIKRHNEIGYFKSTNEPEAILLAAKWILNRIKEQHE